MTSIVRKVMTAVALLVVGGLVIGGTMAFAGGSPTPSAVVATSTSSAPGLSDDGTADQGPGDVPVNGGTIADDDDDDGTADQGPGDFPFEDDDRDGDEHGGDHGDDDNSGPSENSGPGSTDDNSGHGGDD